MVNQFDAVTPRGETLPLSLADISEGYSVQDISGLDPVPANIVSSSFARLDGEQYQSARREKRNIIIKLGLEPDYSTMTAQQLRNRLYTWFMTKRQVMLRFYTDELPPVEINGRVETFDCPLFVKEPVATISIVNHLPDFIDPTEIALAGNTNSTETNTDIVYDGSVDTGFVFTLNVNRTLTSFEIINQALGESAQSMPFVGSWVAGDVIELSTVSGNKYVQLTRSGVRTSALAQLSPFANWITLKEGVNEFRVNAEGAAIPYTIRYTNKYGGL